MAPGDYFELPHFPIESKDSVVFSEGADSFAEWKEISDNIGLVDLIPLDETSGSFFVKAFRAFSDYYRLVPSWGKAMAESKADAVTGIWLRLIDTPVLKPWQAPSTWEELRIVCREQGIALDQHLENSFAVLRDDKPHILLVGFPIPMKVGESLRQMHWQALRLPILSNGIKTAKGFRPNAKGYWRRDRTEIIRNFAPLHWLLSENWHPEQISTRGKFPETISQQKILLIGVGVLGSMLAEILSRGNVQNTRRSKISALAPEPSNCSTLEHPSQSAKITGTGRQNQNRTAIVYFGPTPQDYLDLVESGAKHKAYIEYIQQPLAAQLTPDKHKPACAETSRYTVHSQIERRLQGSQSAPATLPICRVKCCSCRAVFTVLPSFIGRYRRQDTDSLGKLLEMSLGMGLSQRETARIYEWSDPEAGWHPGWIWHLVQWLGNLIPVSLLLMRLGLTPPPIFSAMRSLPH